MNKKKSTSALLFGLTVFTGLLPLAFAFTQQGTQFLTETPLKYAVWCVQAITLLLIILIRAGLSKSQLIALTILCIIVPFTFTFNNNGVSFLILNHTISTILSWAIAIVLLIRLFFAPKSKENSEL